jgi:hypothetical protein
VIRARFKHKVRRRKGGTYPLSHLYGYFGLVRGDGSEIAYPVMMLVRFVFLWRGVP